MAEPNLGPSNSNIEILVHYSAPSTAADDAYYRHLAASYLSFVPGRQTPVTVVGRSFHDSSDPEPAASASAAAPLSSQPLPYDQAVPACPPWSSLSASFSSVIDNAGSPRVHGQTCSPPVPILPPEPAVPSSSPFLPVQDSFSHVSDSQPSVQENSYAAVGDAMCAELGSPSHARHFGRQQLPDTDSPQRTNNPPNPSQQTVSSMTSWVASTPLERLSHRVEADAWEVIIPSSLPIPEFDRLPGPEAATSSPVGFVSSSFAVSLPASQQSASGAAEKENASEEPEACLPDLRSKQMPARNPSGVFHVHNSDPVTPVSPEPRQLQAFNSDTGTLQRQTPYRQNLQQRLYTQRQAASTLQQRQFQEQFYHALEIYSPEPEVSDNNITPGDLITPRLQQVAQDLDITVRFKFIKLREPQPLERGYWKIHTAHWPYALREAAWVFLANWIGAGFAGWGVRCYRDEARSYIRVYCWGIVVGPVYGMIYLASERRLKRDRAEWVDADGNTVVVMEAREKIQ